MIWFDPSSQFGKRFKPTDGGYLFYPRSKGPGKLVSATEYDSLVSNYRRWMGGRFRPGLMFAILFGLILVISIVSVALDLPPDRMNWVAYLSLLPAAGYMFWLWFSPHRLVKGRPDAAPPRTRAERGLATRSLLPWPMIVFGLWLSGFFALVGLSTKPSVGMVVWTIVWAAVFVAYVRLGIQKFRDRRP